jgi:3-oxoacyl-ACP reductase-like protein
MEQVMYVQQRPIGSGFDAFTTARQVATGVDLSGKVAIVTGGYSGLGLEMTRTLVAAGASVVVPARSLDKARARSTGSTTSLSRSSTSSMQSRWTGLRLGSRTGSPPSIS